MSVNYMKRILILIIGLIGVSYGQYAPTSAKTKFVNGVSIGSKDSTYFTNSGDTVILYIGRDSAVYTKFKGSHRKLAFDGSLSAYKLISDSLFANGYTTRARTKQQTDSLSAAYIAADALKKNIADTFFTTGYTTRARTKQVIDSLGAAKQNVLTNPVTGTGTTNTVAKFTGTSTIGNSLITDNGSGVGVNTSTFTSKFNILGDVDFSNIFLSRNASASAAQRVGIISRNFSGATTYGLIGGADVSGTSIDVVIGLDGSVGPNRLLFRTASTYGGGSAERMRLDADKLLIGTTTNNGTDLFQLPSGSALVGNLRTSTNTISSINTNGNIIFDANGTGVIQLNDALLGSSGVTAQRGRFTSLVTNKDSLPITSANAWVLTVDTTGTPYTNRINRRNINDFYIGDATFDTTARILTIPKAGGGSTSVVIPRGTASGASGIIALSSSRTGNIVTVSGDNGSSTIFSVRDADSSAVLQSLTAGNGLSGSPYNGGSPLTWTVDTSIISTKANVTGTLVGYTTVAANALKLNISDTSGMLSNRLKISDTLTMLLPYLRKSDTATMLTPFVQYSDTANQMSGYQRLNFALLLQDTATAFNPYLRKSDTLNMLSPYYRTLDATNALALKLNLSDTASMLSNRLKISDTLTMLSPYARTSNLPSLAPYLLKADSLSGGYTTWLLTKKKIDSIGVLKVNYTDTAAIVANYLRKSDTATMLAPFVQYSDTASIVSGYVRSLRFTDSLTAVQARIQTKQPLGAYITLADSSTILAGRWLPNRSADSIAVIRALVNAKGNGTVTSIATNNGTGISGGTITSTGTLALDTVLLSTRAWRQKAVDSLNALINARVKYTDTAAMLIPFVQYSDTSNMLSPYRRTSTLIQQSEVNGLVGALALKLNIGDTGTMVAPYLRKSDTLNMLSPYRRTTTKIQNSDIATPTISGTFLGNDLSNLNAGNGLTGTAYNGNGARTWVVDTATISTKANVTGLLVAKLNISDTASMLSNRLRISDTLTMLSKYLRKTDTASLVLPYLRKTDTLNMLSPYRRTTTKIQNSDLANATISGTFLGNDLSNLTNGYGISGSPYNGNGARTFSIDTTGISTKANVTALLLGYATNANLATKLNISDTASMLTNLLRKTDTATMLSPYRRTTTKITNSDLANSTISGVSLGSNLANLNASYGLTGGSYNGNGGVDFKVDTSAISTKANVTASLLPKLNLTDTAAMLSNRLKISDTTTMLANYVSLNPAVEQTIKGLKIFDGGIQARGAATSAVSYLHDFVASTRSGNGLIGRFGAVAGLSNGITAKVNNNNDGVDFEVNGRLKSSGLVQPITLKTANYTLTTNDHTVVFDATAANRTATLPAGIEGQIFVIRIKANDNTKSITVNPNGSETIEGSSSYSIFSSTCGNPSYTFQFLSGNWYIISSHIPQCL